MWVPLLIMILGMYFMVAAIAIYRTNSLILAREANKAWVMRLINQSQEGV